MQNGVIFNTWLRQALTSQRTKQFLVTLGNSAELLNARSKNIHFSVCNYRKIDPFN